MKPLSIYILCRNRPDYAKQAIQSVLRQTSQKYLLTVSDNSTNDDVGRMVKDEFTNIHYVRRTPALDVFEHLNRCIEEISTDYFCLFHDDDVMQANYVETMMQCAQDYPIAIAIGCNANMESLGKLEPRTCFRSFRKHELIQSPLNLARRYFSRAQSGFAPFPGYIYSRGLVGNQRFPLDGGKYADTTWLLNLAKQASIVWVNTPLIIYRLHESNDSNVESMRDRLRLLGYLKKNRTVFGGNLLNDYRCSFIYKKIYKQCDDVHLKRRCMATSFLNYYRWSRYLRLDLYQALMTRKLVKWMAER
jgi:GT2 family glycosyltransferase